MALTKLIELEVPAVSVASTRRTRLILSFIFAVVFAYAPVAIRFLVGLFFSRPFGINDYIAEFMFAVIVVSAETLRTIGWREKIEKSDAIPKIAFVVSLILLLFSAVIYGAMLLQELDSQGSAWQVALAFAAISFIVGVIVHIEPSRKGNISC